MNSNPLEEGGSSLASRSEMLAEQAEMDAEFQTNQPVTPLSYDINATSFNIPAWPGFCSKTLSIPANSCRYTRLIFSACSWANYTIFNLDCRTETDKKQAHTIFPRFVNFIGSTDISDRERIKVLKNFEAHRVNIEKVKPQSSGLYYIRSVFRMVLDDIAYYEYLNSSERMYLLQLSRTRNAPASEAKSATLTGWIAEHGWLRLDGVGIGHEMFTRLASPKATMASFSATIETAFLEIQVAKSALIELFRETGVIANDIPVPKLRSDFSATKSAHDVHVRNCFLQTFDLLRAKYHFTEGHSAALDRAMRIFISENIRVNGWERYGVAFFSNKSGYNSTDIVTGSRKLLFSMSFLRELAEYASSVEKEIVVPVCPGETILFHWVMATQTVQASDISKLTRNNFRLVTRRDGRVTHIQLAYHKGRANAVHSTRDIVANTLLGRGLLRYIGDRTPADDYSARLSKELGHTGTSGSFGRLFLMLDKEMREVINQRLMSINASPVFLDSMVALVTNGITKRTLNTGMGDLSSGCRTPLKKSIFGPSLIKNSSVHASSDTFDPTQLMNYHSHTNSTERRCYLTPENEVWINNCGRITRAVMSDLTVNLFCASEEKKQIFNSEFASAMGYIDAKSKETIVRMKLITGKREGRVDGLGFTTLIKDASYPADTLYMTDTPETVMRLRHYLSEVRKKHGLLARKSPEYLLFTVLPTTEWIELLFQSKRLKSINEGDILYSKYRKILPPLFSAQVN
ncbi:MAG: hypothetical protein ACI87Q_000715 [Pseudohongiellaceae bacterium]|jgi:hypothetical protein